MRYQFPHLTTYEYAQPVRLLPHLVRLRPKSNVTQRVLDYILEVNPDYEKCSAIVDLDGNDLYKIWFPNQFTSTFTLQSTAVVETYRENPFEYLLEPWAMLLPFDYPAAISALLQPYLGSYFGSYFGRSSGGDPVAVNVAQEVWQATSGNTLAFLNHLNQQIYDRSQYVIRETGAPFPAGITWNQKLGSCRDVAVLFMEVCRAIGLAARFVSGYQEGDLNSDDRHLHAWAEVYLPGAGWRGYDPTHGLAVADRHIALVTSALPQETAPISGTVQSERGTSASSEMRYQLTIQAL